MLPVDTACPACPSTFPPALPPSILTHLVHQTPIFSWFLQQSQLAPVAMLVGPYAWDPSDLVLALTSSLCPGPFHCSHPLLFKFLFALPGPLPSLPSGHRGRSGLGQAKSFPCYAGDTPLT